jgi:hypothetical protein
VADDDGSCLRKRKGKGAGPTWLLSILNNQWENAESIPNKIITRKTINVWGEAGRLEEYQKGVLGVF